jgi:hypothetical protein
VSAAAAPLGRRKGVPNKVTADVKALAGKYAPAAMADLGRLAIAAESEQARVAAIKEEPEAMAREPSLPGTAPGGSVGSRYAQEFRRHARLSTAFRTNPTASRADVGANVGVRIHVSPTMAENRGLMRNRWR